MEFSLQYMQSLINMYVWLWGGVWYGTVWYGMVYGMVYGIGKNSVCCFLAIFVLFIISYMEVVTGFVDIIENSPPQVNYVYRTSQNFHDQNIS